jgi:hypothetical protein
MNELLVLSYLGGFVAALIFAVRERPPSIWSTDVVVAVVVALWPLSALIALGVRLYRARPPRREP